LTIDVAICTRDRVEDLQRCLASVVAQTVSPCRVLVVNGGRPLGSLGPSVEVVESEPSLPRQRNVALDAVDSELVAFLDDDVELRPGYLEQVVRWFSEHPETIGASGHIENDVPFSSASRAFRRVFSLSAGDGILRPSGDLIYLYHPARPTRVDSLSGSNMVWRRAAIGGLRFDEGLKGYAYMEDVDFSLRAGRRGELWMLSDAYLVHHTTQTSRVAPRAYVRQVLANGAYLFAKHRLGYSLRSAAYARRLLGRSAAYVAVAARTRSAEPLIGVATGIAAVPAALRRGRQARNDANVA
jgi:GT2 family glycosyltransferase